MTTAKKGRAKRAPIEATLELVTDAGFSWSFAPSDIEFCGDELIASFHSYDTMNVRRWRVSDGAVTLDRSFTLRQAQLDRRAVHLQWVADRADPTRGELLWLDRAGQPALLDPRTLEVARALPESEAEHAMVFAADGAIVYVEDGSRVRVIDSETLRERAQYSVEFGAAMASVSASGGHLVIVEKNGTSRAISLADGAVSKLPTDGRQSGVTLLDRSRVVLFTSANAARVVCVRSLDDGPSTDLHCATIVSRTAASRDESTWVAYGTGNAIDCFDTATRSLRWSVTLDGAADSVVFSADGRWIAAATQHRVALIDVRTGALHRSYGPAGAAGALEIGDGFLLASPSITTRNAPHLWTWDTKDPSAKAQATMLATGAATIVEGKIAHVDGAQYSLATVAEELAEKRMTPEQASLVTRTFESFAVDAKGALYHPTSKLVGRKHVHGVERCTRNSDGTWTRVLLGHPQRKRAMSLCVLDAQRQLVVGWESRELSFIDLETGEQLRTISKLKKPAQRIIATRDGSTLALALGGYLLAFVHGSTVTVTARPTSGYAWTPDERWLLSVNYERVDRFDAKTGELRATATIAPSASAIAIAEDGAMYVGALDTNVYRLRVPESFWSD